eukprot:c25009_g1_i1 orf=230-406(+)
MESCNMLLSTLCNQKNIEGLFLLCQQIVKIHGLCALSSRPPVSLKNTPNPPQTAILLP